MNKTELDRTLGLTHDMYNDAIAALRAALPAAVNR